MKVIIIPSVAELIVITNPTGEVTPKGIPGSIMPWLYAPWPEAKQKGIMQTEVPGNTLKALLIELGRLYQQAGVDFAPFNHIINQVDFDYEVSVNGKRFSYLSAGIDTVLKEDDEIKINIIWRWDG